MLVEMIFIEGTDRPFRSILKWVIQHADFSVRYINYTLNSLGKEWSKIRGNLFHGAGDKYEARGHNSIAAKKIDRDLAPLRGTIKIYI